MTWKSGWIGCLFAATVMAGGGCSSAPKQTTRAVAQKSLSAKVQAARVSANATAQGARVVGGAAAGAVGTVVGRE